MRFIDKPEKGKEGRSTEWGSSSGARGSYEELKCIQRASPADLQRPEGPPSRIVLTKGEVLNPDLPNLLLDPGKKERETV